MTSMKQERCAGLWWLPILSLGVYACGDAPVMPRSAVVGSAGVPVAGAPNAGSGGSTKVMMAAAGAGASAMMASGGSSGQVVPTKPAVSGDVTYHKDIRPIIEARCLGCHVAGGVGPFLLDSWDAVQKFQGPVVAAVKAHRMPPWPADDSNCTKLRNNQRLTEAQLALFTMWEGAGYPAGNEADFAPLAGEPPPLAIGEPNLLVTPSPPEQLVANYEGYICKQVDTNFAQDTWVTAMDIVPEHRQYVHHAIVSVGSGNCDALGITAQNVYSFRPGSRTVIFERGDALLIPAGSVIAIQFHFNTKFAPAGMALPTDASPLRLWTLPPGEKPMRQISRVPHHDMQISIPVDAVNQVEGGAQSISSNAGSEIIGMSPHMHYLGQTFNETLQKADGTSTCLVDIPDWDQSWQIDYLFDPASYIKVSAGDSVDQECTYSNRAEDQGKDPTGKPFTPQYTTYGEDTRNEMCLGYIWFRSPL